MRWRLNTSARLPRSPPGRSVDSRRRTPTMKRPAALLAAVAFALVPAAVPIGAQGQSRADAPRPIDAGTSVWAEELTWMEIRDLVKAGTTTLVIGTGGVE